MSIKNLIFNKCNIRILIKLYKNQKYKKNIIKEYKVKFKNITNIKDRMSWEDDDFDVVALIKEQVNNEPLNNEQKRLEERRLVEESDVKISEELFSKTNKIRLSPIQQQIKIQTSSTHQTNKISLSPIQTKPIQTKINNSRNRELEEQRLKQKQKKQEKKRLTETFGEAEVDVYDELYGDIADKY